MRENEQILLKGKKPDFFMLIYYTLPSLFSFSIKVDSDFIGKDDINYRKMITEGKLPTQKRQAFGFIYGVHDSKIHKKIIKLMLEERSCLVAIPICFGGDLEAYNQYKLPVCFWKVTSHF